jgi:preprotein translocase subunit YajC
MERIIVITASGATGGMWIYYALIAAMFIAMYFFTIRPQNKREKELKNLRDNLQVGDEVMTIGGFYGTIVRIKEDRVTIASGAEKTKLELTKSAISTVLNREIPAPGKKQAESNDSDKVSPRNIKKLSKKEDSEEAED